MIKHRDVFICVATLLSACWATTCGNAQVAATASSNADSNVSSSADSRGSERAGVLHHFETQRLTETYYSEGIAAGDLDNDGHVDIVYGPYWFRGPSFTEKRTIYPPVAQPMERYADHFFAWVYDFDQDGFQDVFTVGFPGTPAYVYQNPGTQATETWRKHQVFDWVSNESPHFDNLVGDQRPELVCTRDGFFGYASIDWENPFSTWTFHKISDRIAPPKFGHGLGIGDVNGDGRMDVLHSRGWFEQPHALDQSWPPHSQTFGTNGGAEIHAYDVDGDGDSDVITSDSAHNFGLSWYEQTSPGRFKKHLIMGDHPSENRYGVVFSEPHSVAMADIDGDGLKDIVTGKTYWSHHRQSPMWDSGPVVYWFKLVRTDEGVDWLPFEAGKSSGIGRQVTPVDIDQDGFIDIATGGMLGAHVLLHKASPATDEQIAASFPNRYDGPSKPNRRDVEGTQLGKAMRGRPVRVAGDGKAVRAIEAEALGATVSSGSARPQAMGEFSLGRWSGNSQLWWTGAKPGDRLSIAVDTFKAIDRIQLAMTCARDYAIVRVILDGKEISPPIDLYNPDVISTGILEFKTPELEAGKHQLAIEILGANSKAAKSYMVGIDFLRFLADGEQIEEPDGVKPMSPEGRVLNLDFETGDLTDWTATGNAFAGQPIGGDTVSPRRNDMSSRHAGNFWIGTYEVDGDAAQGTLVSKPLLADRRYASFLVGGGSSQKTRVELWKPGDDKPFYVASGRDREDMREVIVDLRRVLGQEMFIRIVDESSGGWGHINFDHFRLHDKRPGPLTPNLRLLSADEYPHAGLPAEQAAAAMKVPDGFKVSVLAAEPLVKQPIAMAMDHRGRTWIAEAYEYPLRAKDGQGRDRILIFEDTNGDGKFDSRKVFAEGLNLVSGLEVGFGGVWVGAAPYLMFIPDLDGDDIPDSKPEILLDGWGYQDTHETLNAFCWGPDGWLYGCHGVFTHSKVGKPGTPEEQRTRINAGVWRFHPTRRVFEVFAEGTSNPWGVDFNEHGDAFITACVIPHLYHMIPGGRYQRQAGQHFNPNTYDDIKTIADHLHYLGATPHSGNGKSDEAGGGHAHAGAMIYQGGAWPEEYSGKLLMNNIHGQRLNVDALHPDGSGYVGTHAPDFLLTGDQASQILNMRYGPDGQVTMIDWYDMQACHRREAEVHDRSNGRIYRIAYGEPEPVKVDLAAVSDADLVSMTTHSNQWFVRHSRRALQERFASGSLSPAAIKQLWRILDSSPTAQHRLQALWALHVTGNSLAGRADKLFTDESAHIRGWTVRLLTEQANDQLSASQLQSFQRLAQGDPSQVVRRELASAANRLPLQDRWMLLPALVSHPEDANDHNLPLLYWYALEPLAEADPDRALALGIAAGTNIPLLREFMLRRVAGSGSGESLERLVGALSKAEDDIQRQAVLAAIKTSLIGQRRTRAPEGWSRAIESLGDSNQAIALSAASIGAVFGDPQSLEILRQVALDKNSSHQRRLRAIDSLTAVNDEALLEIALEVARTATDAELLGQAIRALSQYDAPQIPQTLLSKYKGWTPAVRRTVIATLCSRASHATAMLEAMGRGELAAADLSADFARQVSYLEDAEVDRLLTQHWGKVTESTADQSAQITALNKIVQRDDLPAPDLARGRSLFAETCQRCHQLYGIGQEIGPDLTGSNRKNLDYLLENIVAPSSVMAKEYRQSVFLTDAGRVVTGLLQSETENAVSVQTADGLVVLPAEEIVERRESPLSLMPNNQLSQFSPTQVRDLIGYLRHSSQTPVLLTKANGGEFFNGKDLTGWTGSTDLWTVAAGEIVGKSAGLKSNEFLISDYEVRDFRLTLEVRLVGNSGNSGIQFRSVPMNGSVEGYQADIGEGWWGKLYEEHGRGLLWDKSGEGHVKLDDWNRYEIEAIGSKVRTWINGNLCVDLDDAKGRQAGIIALQLHSGGPTEVRFRNLAVEPIEETNAKTP